MMVRAILQAGIVLILARSLGPDSYGLVIAIASVTSVFAILMGLGSTALHLKALSLGNISSSTSFHDARRRNAVTFLPLLTTGSLLIFWLYGKQAGATAVLLLVAGDLLAFAASDLLVRHAQGQHQYRSMAFYMCLVPAIRSLAIGFLWLTDGYINVETWTRLNIASGCVALFLAYMPMKKVDRRDRTPQFKWIEGMGFAVSAGSTRIHADADKAIVARFSTMDAAAQYSVAYRFFDILMLPIQSYIEWATPALFREGASSNGSRSTRERRQFLFTTVVSALIMALVSVPLAWVIPALFGPAYSDVVRICHWLAFLPLTSATWWIVRTLLYAKGDQAHAGGIELIGACFNVGITIMLVQHASWHGAVIGTYATHIAMSVSGGIRLLKSARRKAS